MIAIELKKCSDKLLITMAEELENPEELERLLQYNEELLCRPIASNKHTNKSILSLLYLEYKEVVVWPLIKNESTPDDVLHDIAVYCSVGQAEELIHNGSLAPCDIDLLVDRFINNEYIVKAAIKNEKTSGSTLVKIANKYPEHVEQVLSSGKVFLSAK